MPPNNFMVSCAQLGIPKSNQIKKHPAIKAQNNGSPKKTIKLFTFGAPKSACSKMKDLITNLNVNIVNVNSLA